MEKLSLKKESGNKTPQEDPGKVFEQKMRVFDHFLTENDLIGTSYWANNFDTLIEEIKQKKISDEAKALLINEMKEKLLELADATFSKGNSFYPGLQIYESLGKIDTIKDRVARGHKDSNGRLNYDLARATLDYGTEEQAEELMKDWLSERPVDSTTLHTFSETRYFKEKLDIIRENYKKFAVKNKLPEKLPNINNLVSNLEFLNAAVELKKQGHDLAIGVLNSGIHLAQLLDYLGQKTRYVEWHRGWKKSPIWKNIGSDTSKILHEDTILLCEHDVSSGSTLSAMIPFLEKLKPKEVEVSFWIDYNNTNKQKTAQLEFYKKSFLIKEISTENFTKNINEVVEYSKNLR